MTTLVRRYAACATLGLVFTAAAAHGQAPAPRVLVSVGGGVQAGGEALADGRAFDVNAETAVIESRHPFRAGALFDGGVDVRLWRRVAAGVSVSHFSAASTTSVDARIPHPFQFNAHREIDGSTSARRSETGVHAQVRYHLPLQGRLRAILFAGPSFVSARQDLVQDVRYDETYPYDTATFASAELSRASGSGIGVNAGADVFWVFSRRIGAGMLVRYARASLDLDGPASRRIPLDAGGTHIALGARASF